MPIVRQASFAGGELSPTLYARTELERYRIGARALRNFIVTPFGALANRPGTRHVTFARISDLVAVCLSSNQCVKSTNGLSWSTDTLPSTQSRYSIASNGSRFVTCGGTSAVWEVSDDNGDTWTTKVKPDSYAMYGVFWDGANFHACGEAGKIERSTNNGETWTTQTMSPAVGLSNIAGGWFGSSYLLIAAGSSGQSFYSTNKGVSWTAVSLPRVITYNDIAYGDGVAIAVGNNYIARTTNGTTWSEIALTGNHTAVVCVGGVWWIFNQTSGTSHKSTDGGLTWSSVTMPGTHTAFHPVYSGGNLVVPCTNGFWVGPPDGSAWSFVSVSGDWRGVASLYSAAETTHPRLVPFVFSDEQALVLEFRAGLIKFIEDGAYVMAGASAYSIVSPYAESDLPRLKFAQMGNIITITHPNYTPRELERTSASPLTFTLTTITFDAPANPLTVAIPITLEYDAPLAGTDDHLWKWALSATCQSLDGTRTWESIAWAGITMYKYYTGSPAWDVLTTYAIGDHVLHNGKSWISLQSANLGNDPDTSPTWWDPELWANGIEYIDLAYTSPKLRWTEPTPSTYRIISWNLYRGIGDLVGLLTVLNAGIPGERYFIDDGKMEPDYTMQPPKGENPFKIYSAAGALVRTEEPTTVAYQDERLIFGGTAERPNYLFMSRTGDWKNFDQYPLVKDDDSIIVGLAGRKFEEIRSLVPGRSLLTFTTMSEWAVDGGQPDKPMIPTEISARIRSERGSTWLDALKVGDDHVLFCQRKGMIVRDLAYDGQAGTYVNSDLSLFCRHLFAGKQVVDWCWAEDPWSVIWAILDDGTLLSMTYMPEMQVVAWATHPLGGSGIAEAICSVPEGEEDIVYLQVRRGGIRSIERLSTRTVSNSQDGIFLDNSMSFNLSTPATVITGLTHLEGQSVYALADGVVRGPFTVASGSITLPVAASKVHVGFRYDCDFESLDCPPGEGKTRVKSIKQGWVELEASAGTIKVGQDFSHLEAWSGNEADEAVAVNGLTTGQARVPTISHWNHGGRICVRQSDPLPVTILAVTREVEYG